MSRERRRKWFQAVLALGINAWLPNWPKGKIFQGGMKGACVPVLNCYSCPSAMYACPIGSIQTFMGSLRFNLSIAQKQIGLYVIGMLGAVGAVVGRMPCGWACPFGLFQEIVHKIPSPKIRIPRVFSYFRYVVLALFVFILPLVVLDQFGIGETWFCKWICPAGSLEAGIPLVALNQGLRGLVGFMYAWKLAILGIFLVWMVFSIRPFCRTTCPLGAFLGLFNRTSVFRMAVDEEKCIRCGVCRRRCPVEHAVNEAPNSPVCIRCLECLDSCRYGAVTYSFPGVKRPCPAPPRTRTAP